MLRVRCPHCGEPIKLKDSESGSRQECSECQRAFRAPEWEPREKPDDDERPRRKKKRRKKERDSEQNEFLKELNRKLKKSEPRRSSGEASYAIGMVFGWMMVIIGAMGLIGIIAALATAEMTPKGYLGLVSGLVFAVSCLGGGLKVILGQES